MAEANVVRQDVVRIVWDVEDSPLNKLNQEAKTFQSSVGKAVGTTENKFGELTNSVKKTQKQLQQVKLSDKLQSDIDLANKSLGKIKGTVEAVTDKLAELKTQASSAVKSVQSLAKQSLSKVTDDLRNITTAVKNVVPNTKEFVTTLKNASKQKLTTTHNELKRIKSVLTEGQTGAKGFSTAVKNIGKISLANAVKGITNIKKGFTNAKTAAKNFTTSLKTGISVGFSKCVASANKFLASIKRIDKEKFTQLLTGINNLTKRLGTGLVTAAKKAAKAVAAIGVGTAVGAFKLTDMASDLSETVNKVDVSFGDSAGAVKKWSKDSIKSMGLAQQTALDMAALFGDMGTGMGISQKEASNMSMTLTQLGADLASFKNMDIEEVTTALNGVFTGETESLKRLGVVMTQTNLEAFALSKGLKKPLDEMSESEKVMLRYEYVLSKTKNAQGDFARTGGGFANQLRMAKEQLKQIGTTIGGVFIGSFESALGKINSFGTELNAKLSEVLSDGFQFSDIGKITPMLGSVGTVIQKIADKIKSITSNKEKMEQIKSVFEAVKGAAGKVAEFVGKCASKITDFVTSSGFLKTVQTVVDGISKAFGFVNKHLDTIIEILIPLAAAFGTVVIAINAISTAMKIWSAVQWVLNSGLLACPITWIVLAIAALVAIIVVLVRHWDKVKEVAINCWNKIKDAFGKAASWFDTTVIQPVVGFFTNLWNKIRDGASKTWSGIKQVFSTVINWVKKNFLSIILFIINPFAGIFSYLYNNFEGFRNFVNKIVSSIASFFTGLWDNIVSGAKKLWSGICSVFSAVGKWVYAHIIQPVINFFKGLGTVLLVIVLGIVGLICQGFLKISGWVNTHVVQPVVNFFVALWTRIKIIANSIVSAIKSAWVLIANWVNAKIVQPVVSFFVSLWNRITHIVNRVWATIKAVWGLISSWVNSKIIQPVVSFFTKLWERITTVVRNVWNTLRAIWHAIPGWVNAKIVQPVVNFFSVMRSKLKQIVANVWNTLCNVWGKISGWVNGKVISPIKSFFSGLWQNITEKVRSIKETIVNAFKSAWDKVTSVWSGLKGFFKGIWDGLKNTGSSLKDSLVSIWKDAVKAISKPVNKLIGGANWVLEKLGSEKKIAEWQPYAKGTNGHPGGNAIVNDGRGAELVQMPNGNTFIPKGRNVLLPNAPKGMKVLDAQRTAQLMGKSKPTFNYDGGIGDWEIWDFFDNAKGLANKLIDKFVNYNGMAGYALDAGKAMISNAKNTVIEWVKSQLKLFGGKGLGDYNASAGVEQWRSTVAQALKMEGQHTAANVNRTLYQMQTESGGNPKAINNWDSNAKKGTPSKGLMQVIDPTFKAYAKPGHDKNIYDPLSNILASIRYAVSRYGSLEKAYRGVGYENGIGFQKVTMPEVATPNIVLPGNDNPTVNPIVNPIVKSVVNPTIKPIINGESKNGIYNGITTRLSNILASVRSMSAQTKAYNGVGYADGIGESRIVLPAYTPASSVTNSNVSSNNSNHYAPSFTLNMSGTVDRTTERTIKRWVQEALEDTFESMSRTNPRLTEV